MGKSIAWNKIPADDGTHYTVLSIRSILVRSKLPATLICSAVKLITSTVSYLESGLTTVCLTMNSVFFHCKRVKSVDKQANEQ